MRQLGCEYSGKDSEKTFKKNASAALRKVKNAHPMLKTGKEIGGFSVLPTSGLAIVPRAPATPTGSCEYYNIKDVMLY
jgi:hypothetical protein